MAADDSKPKKTRKAAAPKDAPTEVAAEPTDQVAPPKDDQPSQEAATAEAAEPVTPPELTEPQAAAEEAAPEAATSTEEPAAAPVAEEAAEAPDAPKEADAAAEAKAPARRSSGSKSAPEGREKPVAPGADLDVDIVPEGVDPLAQEDVDPYALEYAEPALEEALEELVVEQRPIEKVAIDLAAGALYRATGKRKTAIARVTLRPGKGTYTINGRGLEEYFPRITAQRNIRQPLETVGYEARMDVVARMHGGGVSAQAGALRHGISRALLEADPNLRGELKRRGFLTRDARAKERKKAGLKKARKRPQFSKR